MNAAFVSAVCDQHETKSVLLYKVQALQGDLQTVKQTCKDQEYHMQRKEQEYQTERSEKEEKTEKEENRERY